MSGSICLSFPPFVQLVDEADLFKFFSKGDNLYKLFLRLIVLLAKLSKDLLLFLEFNILDNIVCKLNPGLYVTLPLTFVWLNQTS